MSGGVCVSAHAGMHCSIRWQRFFGMFMLLEQNCTLHLAPCTLPLARHFCAGEVQDLSKQLDQGGLSTHELEKVKRKLEAEIDELTQQLQVCAGHGSSLEIRMSHKPPDVCAWCWLHRLQVVSC